MSQSPAVHPRNQGAKTEHGRRTPRKGGASRLLNLWVQWPHIVLCPILNSLWIHIFLIPTSPPSPNKLFIFSCSGSRQWCFLEFGLGGAVSMTGVSSCPVPTCPPVLPRDMGVELLLIQGQSQLHCWGSQQWTDRWPPLKTKTLSFSTSDTCKKEI